MQRREVLTITGTALLFGGGALGPIRNVFLHVPDDFDVVAWAKGE